jgi:D-glycero-D-manno-heptose 1,7-bisphosphate phosphatase
VVTNQAGIGRGYYSEQDFLSLSDWMRDVFLTQGVIIDKIYYCPFHPEYGLGRYKVESSYRKPGPGMILQAAREFDVDLSRSVLVGDKESDIQAGISAGVGFNILYDPIGTDHPHSSKASAITGSLQEVATVLLDTIEQASH